MVVVYVVLTLQNGLQIVDSVGHFLALTPDFFAEHRQPCVDAAVLSLLCLGSFQNGTKLMAILC